MVLSLKLGAFLKLPAFFVKQSSNLWFDPNVPSAKTCILTKPVFLFHLGRAKFLVNFQTYFSIKKGFILKFSACVYLLYIEERWQRKAEKNCTVFCMFFLLTFEERWQRKTEKNCSVFSMFFY